MNEAPKSHPSTDSGPQHGPLLILGLPVAVEVLTVYILIAVDTPVTPLVNRLHENAFGVFTLACIGLLVVCLVMAIVLTIAERRHRNRRDQRGPSAV